MKAPTAGYYQRSMRLKPEELREVVELILYVQTKGAESERMAMTRGTSLPPESHVRMQAVTDQVDGHRSNLRVLQAIADERASRAALPPSSSTYGFQHSQSAVENPVPMGQSQLYEDPATHTQIIPGPMAEGDRSLRSAEPANNIDFWSIARFVLIVGLSFYLAIRVAMMLGPGLFENSAPNLSEPSLEEQLDDVGEPEDSVEEEDGIPIFPVN